MSKHFDVISIGSAIQDIFILNQDLKCSNTNICHPFNPDLLGKKIKLKAMHFDIGGGGSNTAATFANMNLKTSLLSQIGNDLAGKQIIKTMKKFKVDTGLIAINKKEETGYSVIFIDPAGDRTILVFRGASEFRHFKPPLDKLNANWFFITSAGANLKLLKQIFDLAKKHGTKIAWNPGSQELDLPLTKLKPLLTHTNVLLLNLKETQTLTKSKTNNIKLVLSKLSHLTPKALLAVTAGKNGAWVKTPSEPTIYHASVLKKTIVNTTGAGDAFGSGLVAGLILYSGNIKKSLALAILNSNQVVTQMGAKHGLLLKPPTKKMLAKVKIKTI